MPRRSLYALMTFTVLMWGGAFVAIKELLPHTSVWAMVLLRFLLTTSALWAVMLVVRPASPRIARDDRGRLLVLGFCGVAGYHLALNAGERFVSADVASLIAATMPVMVAVLAAGFLGERLSAVKIGGIGLALAGVTVLAMLGTPGATLSVSHVGGVLITALAPLSWAVYTIVSKPMVKTYGALPLAAKSLGVGTLMLLPFAAVPTAHALPTLSASDWAWLMFLGVGCSAFSYVIWFTALERLEASQVAAWVYLVPLCALGWGAVVLHEPVTRFVLVGGAMVLAGVIVIERVAPRRATARAAQVAREVA